MPESQWQAIVNWMLSAFVVTGVAGIMAKAVAEEEGHHSIPWEAKRRLTERYGKWAVNRAEAFCPENDVACVEREAKRLFEVIQYRR